MERTEIYTLLDVPGEVVEKLNAVAGNTPYTMTAEVKEKYLCRATAEEGHKILQEKVAPDPDGMKELYAVMELCRDVWSRYERMGISREIFAETMKLIPRFLRSHHAHNGAWHFHHGWWFWRELAMEEFRVGCLEYELVQAEGRRFISLHIPSDADMSRESIDASMADFQAFLQAYYPDWQGLAWECDSWMMSPVLQELLPENSRILAFQNRFEMLENNEDSMGVLEWVFPGYETVSEDLPENTSLQRKMKAWLLSGKKVGWTRAVLKQ